MQHGKTGKVLLGDPENDCHNSVFEYSFINVITEKLYLGMIHSLNLLSSNFYLFHSFFLACLSVLLSFI